VGVHGEKLMKIHIGHVTALRLMESEALVSGKYPPTFQMKLLPPSSVHFLIYQAKLQGRETERRVVGVKEAEELLPVFGGKLGYRDNSVGIATRYRVDGAGIESRWGRDFPHPSRPALVPTQPPIQWLPGLFSESKAAGAWR
jgi:hypothetical protein